MNIQPLLPVNIQNLVSLSSWPTGNTADVLQRQLQQQMKIRFEIEKTLKTKNENERKSLFENLYNHSSSMLKELLNFKKMNQDKHFNKEDWNKKAYFAFTLNSILATIALNLKMDFYKKQLQKERMQAYLEWRRHRLIAAAAEQDRLEEEEEEEEAEKAVEQRLNPIEEVVKEFTKKMDARFTQYINDLGLDDANKQQLIQIKNQHFQNIGQSIVALKLLTQERPLHPHDHADIAKELEKTMHSFESFVDDSKKLILGAGKQIDHRFENCINAMRHDMFQVVNKAVAPIVKQQQPANQPSILTETFGRFKQNFESFEHAFGKVLGAYEHHHKTASKGVSHSLIHSGPEKAGLPKEESGPSSDTPRRKSIYDIPKPKPNE